jgi:hypothetical protein
MVDKYHETKAAHEQAESKMARQKPGKAKVMAQIELNKVKFKLQRSREDTAQTLREKARKTEVDHLLRVRFSKSVSNLNLATPM